MYKYMDDFLKLVIILSFLLFGGIQYYCYNVVCDAETNRMNILTFVSIVYVVNIYLLVKGFANYKKNDLWKIIGILLLVPFIAYTRMCENNCYEMSGPVLFILIPCIMIILNIYFLMTTTYENKRKQILI
jgi:hypothetical protein